MNLSPNLGKGNTAAAVYPAIDAQGNVYVAFSEGVVAAYDNQGNELWRYPASGTMGKIDQGGPAIRTFLYTKSHYNGQPVDANVYQHQQKG